MPRIYPFFTNTELVIYLTETKGRIQAVVKKSDALPSEPRMRHNFKNRLKALTLETWLYFMFTLTKHVSVLTAFCLLRIYSVYTAANPDIAQ